MLTRSASLEKTSAFHIQGTSPVPPRPHPDPRDIRGRLLVQTQSVWHFIFCASNIGLSMPASCALTTSLVYPLRISGHLLSAISFSLASHLPFSTTPALNIVTGRVCFQISQIFGSRWKLFCQTAATAVFGIPGPSFHRSIAGVTKIQ